MGHWPDSGLPASSPWSSDPPVGPEYSKPLLRNHIRLPRSGLHMQQAVGMPESREPLCLIYAISVTFFLTLYP